MREWAVDGWMVPMAGVGWGGRRRRHGDGTSRSGSDERRHHPPPPFRKPPFSPKRARPAARRCRIAATEKGMVYASNGVPYGTAYFGNFMKSLYTLFQVM